jgi:hypothetical protein
MRREQGGAEEAGRAAHKRRTVAELLREAEHAADEQRRVEAEKAAQEKAHRLEALRVEHARKPTLIERLQEVGLGASETGAQVPDDASRPH